MSRLKQLGLVLAAFGLFMAYDWYDKSFNYTPVLAKITGAEVLCYLSKGSRRKTVSDEKPCPVMRVLASSHPEYKDFTVHENVHLAYTYEIGGKTYSGNAVRDISSHQEKYDAGGSLEVLVSKADPAQSRWK